MTKIFINGWGSSKRIWDSVQNASGKTFDTISWTFFTQNTHPAAMLPDNSVMVGWSIGALFALQTAVKNPEKVSSLVLISGCARMTADKDYPGADARAIRAMKMQLRRDKTTVLRNFGEMCFSNGKDSENYVSEGQQFDTSVLNAGLDILAQTDLRESLDNVTIPVKLIHGTDDTVIPFACSEILRDTLPNAELIRIERGLHGLPITHPKKIAELTE